MSRKPASPRSARIRLYRPKRNRIAPILAILLVAAVGSYLVFISSAATRGGGGGGVISHSVQPAANPAISQTCTGALNIALVADVSGSINSTEMSQMQTGFRSLISDLLPGTKAEFSLTEFDTNATVLQNFTSNPTTLDNAINRLGGGANTHWDAGLETGYGTFSTLNSTAPRLLIIATDGDPDPASGLDAAITDANAIKAAGVHILAIGLGTGPNTTNMETLSGPNLSTGGTNVSINTDVITTDFSTLGATLLNVIVGGCPSGVGGIGNGGTGVGTNGNGKGSGGTGSGSGGSGTGTQGSGTGSNGSGSGNTAGPAPNPTPNPTPTPSSQPTTQTTPTPTPTPNPQQAPSSAPTQTTQPQPQPAPKPTAQGTQTQPPTITPSPFYDGKQYLPGSAPDSLASTVKPPATHVWWYVFSGLLLALLAGGFLVWKKRITFPTGKSTKQPKKRLPTRRKNS